ncbi:Bromodomain-containing protein [Scenedesmus sp. NREL 46B-D3]|nr:Bromodomain-containing protein [Scenedesmus sp. NREL 46B-D3]
MMKLLMAVDKRDKFRFFTSPVTDQMAPNYSKIIKQPMDLSTMKSKVERGLYDTWADLQADIVLMFTNAKTYNAPATMVHKQADALLTGGLKMVRNFKQGKTKLRGFTGAWRQRCRCSSV